MQRHKKKPEIGRRYFHGTLTDAIMAKPNPMPAAAHAKGGFHINHFIICFSDAV